MNANAIIIIFLFISILLNKSLGNSMLLFNFLLLNLYFEND